MDRRDNKLSTGIKTPDIDKEVDDPSISIDTSDTNNTNKRADKP